MNFSFNGSLVGRYGSASMFIIYASLVISMQFKRNLLAGIIIAFSILAGTFYTHPVNTLYKIYSYQVHHGLMSTKNGK